MFSLSVLAPAAGDDGKLRDISNRTPEVDSLLEIAYTPETVYTNPYDPELAEADAVFITPDNSKIKIPAFWYEGYERTLKNDTELLKEDGIREWRIRFTPRSAGQYSCFLRIIDHQKGTVSRIPSSGNLVFNVRPSQRAGFLRVSRTDPSYLEYDNGDFFIGLGHNLNGWEWPGKYINRTWNGTSNSRGTYDYDNWFAKMKAAGANLCQLHLCESNQLEWSFVPGYPEALPCADQWNGLVRYNQKVAWKMDYKIRLAESSGIFFRLTLLHWEDFDSEDNFLGLAGHAPNWSWEDRNPYNRKFGGPLGRAGEFFSNQTAFAIYKKQLRYIVARWGYSPNLLAWELWNEADAGGIWGYSGGFGRAARNVANWHKNAAGYIRNLDVNRHLITTSFENANQLPAVWQLEDMDITTIHRYTMYNEFDTVNHLDNFDTVAALNTLTDSRFSKTEKPVIFGEFALSPGGDIQRTSDPDGIAFHNQLWASVFSKSAATAMHWNWASYIDANNLYFHYKALAAFLAGEDLRGFKKTSSSNGKSPVRIMVLQKENRALVWILNKSSTWFAKKQGTTPVPVSSINIPLPDMPPGTYTITIYDTYTGKIIKTQPAGIAADKRKPDVTIQVPATAKDLALKIFVKIDN